MYSPKQFERKPDEFGSLAGVTLARPRVTSTRYAIKAWDNEGGSSEFLGSLDGVDSVFVDNAAWPSADSAERALPHSGKNAGTDGDAKMLAGEEDQILRSLGAAVIMRWNAIPTKLQKELFDNASSVEGLMRTGTLKRQIARFLHKRKDD
jgi:hypothetical protein